MFANILIGKRMVLAFSVVLLIMVALIWSGVKGMKDIQENLKRVVETNNVRIALANEFDKDLDQIYINMRNIIINPDHEKDKEYVKRIEGFREDYRAKLKKVEEMISKDDTKGHEIIAKFKEIAAVSGPLNNKVIELALVDNNTEAASLLSKEAAPMGRKVSEVVKTLIEHNMERNKIRYKKAVEEYEFARNLMLGMGAVAILISLLAAVFLTRGIVNPLSKAVDVANRLAAGDLTVDVAVTGTDETGQLLAAMKTMTESLRSTISQIGSTSTQVASAANQLHATADRIATGAEEVAAQAGTVATAGEEMSATSGDIAQNCQMAAEGAQRASLSAQNGAEVVEKTVAVMGQIAEKVQESAKTVESLGQRSDQIGAIIGTIEDIADQTNLLALNAAIEAARAGEQGRGFAVVADEVRALAERTTRATKEIGEMIKAIQKETKGAVTAMEQGVHQVENGTFEAARSGQALQDILQQINDVAMQVNQIATAAEEQTATTGEISNNMQQITEVVQQTSQGAHESAKAAAQLNGNADELQRLVRQFKL